MAPRNTVHRRRRRRRRGPSRAARLTMTLSVTFSIVATVVQGCGASPDHGAATASAPGDGKVSQQAPPGQGAHASPSLAARPGSPDGRTGKPVAKPTRSAPPPPPPVAPDEAVDPRPVAGGAGGGAPPRPGLSHPGTPPIDKPKLVGWHGDGPAPGEKGTALAIGHRDTLTGLSRVPQHQHAPPGQHRPRHPGGPAHRGVHRRRGPHLPEEVLPRQGGVRRAGAAGAAADHLRRTLRQEGYAANVVVFAHLTGVAKA